MTRTLLCDLCNCVIRSYTYGLIPGCYKNRDKGEILITNHIKLQHCKSCRFRLLLSLVGDEISM